jgi:peptidoglycan/LPS O-acetylase OafA/YrhL
MTTASPTRYRPDIDGLRAMAIVPVVGFHAFPDVVPGGFVGVDVFFVISGYLISLIILGGLHAGTFSFSNFYARRIRRIFPALVLILLASLAWGWFRLFAGDFAQLGKHVAGGAGFVANFTLWNEAGYFEGDTAAKPLLHLWSLGIEEQFYLFWPTALYLAWKRRFNLLAVVLTIFFASFAINVVQVRSDEVAAFYSPITRLWELLLGAALAYTTIAGVPDFRAARALVSASVPVQRVLREIGAIAGVAGVAASVFLFSEDTSFPGWRAALPTGATLLLIAAGPHAWVNRRILSRRVIVWIGLISYPLYLWHWPLLSFARIAEGGTPSAVMKAALIAASVALAAFTYLVIERPIRFRWRGKVLIASLCALMALAGAGGYLAFRAGGFVDRPINRSDVAHFLQYYDELRKTGLADAYRADCDFMDWATEQTRSSLPQGCTRAGIRATVFLWGDSYAAALAHGIRSVLPADAGLAQVTTSGCAPRLVELNPDALGGRCRIANGFARRRISELKPDVLIVAQILAHTMTDWNALAAEMRAAGAKDVVLVGPAPQWLPSLPVLVTRHHWGESFDRVGEGLNPEQFETDRALNDALHNSSLVRYVSLIGALCNASGCLAALPNTDRQLMAVDQGHLSPFGSIYVADIILRPYLPAR